MPTPPPRGRHRIWRVLAPVMVAAGIALAVLAGVYFYAGAWLSDWEPFIPSSGNPEVFDPVTVAPRFDPLREPDLTIHTATEVGDQLDDLELVLGVVIEDEARAYPINMLTGPIREIFNDTLGGKSIAATW